MVLSLPMVFQLRFVVLLRVGFDAELCSID